MIKYYFKIAWRNLWKNKTYSFLNIFGLAIGLCCFLLITLFVADELSYDRFYPNADRIYRINSDINFGGSHMHMAQTSDMMGQLLKEDYPQVEDYTRVYTSFGDGSKLINKGNEYLIQWGVAHVDSTFFDVFALPAIEGDLKTALDQPNTVVITESIAKKYFGTTDVLGKVIETKARNEIISYQVTAVIKDIPENSHFQFGLFFPMSNVDYEWGQLTSHNFYTYLLLRKGTDYTSFEKNLTAYVNKYFLPEAKQFMSINSMEEFEQAGNKIEYSLIPLTKIHLYSDYMFEFRPGGNIQYIYIFSAVAIFILIIACINFMNLTTARSSNRSKEVGIRKVLGTKRKELVVQFLFESTILVILALFIAIVLVYLTLPFFNDLTNKQIVLQGLFTPYILSLLVVLPFVVGFISGSYPAFFLSSFLPVEVLKGKSRPDLKSGNIRSTLVVFQFMASIVFIIGTMVVYHQLNYIQTKDIGFNKDQVLIINGTSALNNNTDTFKNEILQISGVVSGTTSSYLPVSSSRSDNVYWKEAVMSINNGFDLQTWRIDEDYLQTMGIKLVNGRNFSREYGGDSTAVIINETTAEILGYENPIDKKIYRPSGKLGQTVSYNIIGVVADFNYETLHKKVGALGLFLGNSTGNTSFKVNTSNINSLITQIQDKWEMMSPGIPFRYRFLDESFNQMYSAEQRVGKIALLFSLLAVFIACMGLFGLATFIAEQRTKEISIRKVLGASVGGIVRLLSKDFIKLVLIAIVIAVPLAWWGMNTWLQDFTYRVNMDWWIFALAGISAVLIALITVSFQAIKAALTNPAKSLRTE